jgi:hypothetical protein
MMAAVAILDLICRFLFSPNRFLPFVVFGISYVTATAFAQDVTLTNRETTANISPSPPAGWSEPPPLNEPPSPTEPPPGEIEPSLPASRSEAGVPIAAKNDGDTAVSPNVNRFHYSMGLQIRGVYDDNISFSSSGGLGGYYFAIEPSVNLGFGDSVGGEGNYIRFNYKPSFFVFVDHDEENSIQHIISLGAYHRFSRLALTLDQGIELLDNANLNTSTSGLSNSGIIDVGGQNPVNLYNTRLDATYDLTGKTFLSGGLGFSISDYRENLTSSAYLSGNIFINYNYSPKLVIGLGGTGGYNWVESPSPNETFEQVNLRVGYQVTGKISLSASGGVEFRQFEGDARGGYISPVYNLSATYQPFDGTTITLSGNGSIQNSAALAGQDYRTTNITAVVQQRFLTRMHLGLTVGYEHAEYFGAANGVTATRDDNYYFIQPSVDVTVTRWWIAGAYYLHREDNSSTEEFSFNNNQFGVRSEFTF